MIEASCHCGNVRIRVGELPVYLVSCNCSICRRIAALWAYYSSEDVDVDVAKEQTRTYVWGEGMIAFHHCPGCGCATHYTTTGKADGDRVGLNCRMVTPAEIEDIPIRRFDGAESWKFIDDHHGD